MDVWSNFLLLLQPLAAIAGYGMRDGWNGMDGTGMWIYGMDSWDIDRNMDTRNDTVVDYGSVGSAS